MAKAALAEAERVEAEQRAKFEAPAKAQKARILVDAEAEAEKRRLEAEGEAAAIYAKLEAEARGQYEILAKKGEGLKQIVEACGGAQQAFQLMMLEHLDTLAETSAKAISNIKFDKVVVWENGGANGRSNTADFLHKMAGTLPPMLQVMRDIGGIEIPESLAKLVGRRWRDDATANGQRERREQSRTATEDEPMRRATKPRGVEHCSRLAPREYIPLAEREDYIYFASCCAAPGEHVVDRHLRLVDFLARLRGGAAALARALAAALLLRRCFRLRLLQRLCGAAGAAPAAPPARAAASMSATLIFERSTLRRGRLAPAGAASGFAFAVAAAARCAGFAAPPARAAASISATDGLPAFAARRPAAAFAAGFCLRRRRLRRRLSSLRPSAGFRRRLVDDLQELRVDVVPADVEVVVVELHQRPAAHVDRLHAADDVAKPGQLRPRAHRRRRTCPCTRASSFRSARKHRELDLPKCSWQLRRHRLHVQRTAIFAQIGAARQGQSLRQLPVAAADS